MIQDQAFFRRVKKNCISITAYYLTDVEYNYHKQWTKNSFILDNYNCILSARLSKSKVEIILQRTFK